MTRETERLPLPGHGPGTERFLTLHSYGAPEARPKAYLQAALHADEVPAMLVQHHLLRRLDEAAAAGAIRGRIVIAPYANPIGLAQVVNGRHLGRYRLAGGGNFNRNWPDLLEAAAERVAGRLTGEAAANVALIRTALAEALDAGREVDELTALRRLLAREAVDADLVLDLHCDDEALMHLYTLPVHWPGAADLAAELGCRAVLLADPTGGDPFDEVFSALWTRLAERFPGHPIPPAGLAATIELRGQADVSDELAAADAAALFRVLQRRGLIEGDPGPLPAPQCEASDLAAVDVLQAPAAGIAAYHVALGERVRKGQVVADLVDPAGDPGAARRPVASRTEGFVLSRRLHKYVMPGMTLAKIVGREALPHRAAGPLIED